MLDGFPDHSAGKESACNAGDTGDTASIPGSGRSPGEGKWAPPSSKKFLPGEFHGQRSLVGYSPWSRRESDVSEGPEHTPMQHVLVVV